MLQDPEPIYPEMADPEATNDISEEDEMRNRKSVVRDRFLQLAASTLSVGKII